MKKRPNRLALAVDFVNKNKSLFANGGTIPEQQLCQHFGITRPSIKNCTFATAATKVRKHAFAKLAAYTAINKLVRPQGAVMSQKSDTYVVRAGPQQTAPVAKFYINRINTLQSHLGQLN